MGRHVLTGDNRDEQQSVAFAAVAQQATMTSGAAPSASIAPPPGTPADPSTPGTPDFPGSPEPSPFPGSPEPNPVDPSTTPAEPAPYAPDESYDGTVTGQPGMSWPTASQEVIR